MHGNGRAGAAGPDRAPDAASYLASIHPLNRERVRAGAVLARGVEGERPLPAGRDELIMVIDDEESIRNVTRQTLEAFGYSVLCAHNGGRSNQTALPNVRQFLTRLYTAAALLRALAEALQN